MHANRREEREEIGAGDIAAAVGLKFTTTGDTLAVGSAPIVLESMSFPDPVISVAIEPKTKADQDKLSRGACSGSPRRTRPSASRRTRRRGRRSSPGWASCTSRSSSTAYCASSASRATSAARRSPAGDDHQPAEKIQGRFVRQTGGSSQYGDVVVRLYQNPGEGYEFVDKIVGGKIPKVHPGSRPGHRGGDELRHPRRVPGRRRQDRARRRLVPRGRLERGRPSRSRAPWRSRHEAREAEAPRAGHVVEWSPRRVPRRRHW